MTSKTPSNRDARDPRQLLAASLSRRLTAVEQASLDAWAGSSPAVREEIAQTREIWLTAGLVAEDPLVLELRRSVRLTTGLDRPVARRAAARDRRWWIGGVGLAAAALLAGLLLTATPDVRTYAAPAHEVAQLTLGDGSHVTLSPGGELTARLSRRSRALTLVRGDAFFDVTHDRHRPFSVAVDGRTLTVLGTRFNVAAEGPLTVSLVQGSLQVSQADGTSVLLRPGQRYIAANAASGRAEPGDVASDAAWTQGRLIFANTRLADAVARMSRLSGRRVLLADPALGDLRLSGSVRITRIEDIRVALEGTLPVSTRLTSNGDLVITRTSS